MPMEYPHETLWEFNTANWRVTLHAEDETIPVEGNAMASGDVDIDAEAEAFCREGGSHWFTAIVAVWYCPDGDEPTLMGWDTLGCCSYNSFKEFYAGHRDPNHENRNTLAMKARNRVICHYFPVMVRTAVTNAREYAKGLKLREVA